MCVFLAICHDLVCYKMLFLNGKEVDNDDGKEVDNDDDSGLSSTVFT